MQHISELTNRFQDQTYEKKPPPHYRAYWIEQCCELTGMSFKVIFGKTRHLPAKWIQDLYDEAHNVADQRDKTAVKKKFWWLLRQTK